MADLARDIRLAVDTGKVAIGSNETMEAIMANKAKLVVVATGGNKELVNDIAHLCNVSNIKLLRFKGDSMSFGEVCGKPYSVSALAILDPGASSILNQDYEGV